MGELYEYCHLLGGAQWLSLSGRNTNSLHAQMAEGVGVETTSVRRVSSV